MTTPTGLVAYCLPMHIVHPNVPSSYEVVKNKFIKWIKYCAKLKHKAEQGKKLPVRQKTALSSKTSGFTFILDLSTKTSRGVGKITKNTGTPASPLPIEVSIP